MKKHLPSLVLLGGAIVVALALLQLFELRFEAGDVYPAYSSLRADPLGTMALYESLEKIPGRTVRRDFSTANRLPTTPATVYLQCAARPYEWDHLPDALFRELKSFLAGGGRLVITYFPPAQDNEPVEPPDTEQTNDVKWVSAKTGKTNLPPVIASRNKKLPGDTAPSVDLQKAWGFHTSYENLPQAGDDYGSVTVTSTCDSTPARLDWHSSLIFTNCDGAWRTIYARGTNAVVIERTFGRGSVVLASDSFFLSNEALARDRHANLLAWLIGPSRHIVFDEAHLGITESPGVAALIRKYRLHGLAAGLLLLAGLFIWKNATSLVPPPATGPREDFIAGKEAAAGFVNLLRRNISAGDLLAICYAEWKKSAAPAGAWSQTREQQAEAIFQSENSQPLNRRNPVAAYHRIAKTLGKQKTHL